MGKLLLFPLPHQEEAKYLEKSGKTEFPPYILQTQSQEPEHTNLSIFLKMLHLLSLTVSWKARAVW